MVSRSFIMWCHHALISLFGMFFSCITHLHLSVHIRYANSDSRIWSRWVGPWWAICLSLCWLCPSGPVRCRLILPHPGIVPKVISGHGVFQCGHRVLASLQISWVLVSLHCVSMWLISGWIVVFLMFFHIVALVSRLPVTLFMAMHMGRKFLVVVCLGSGCFHSRISLYATACIMLKPRVWEALESQRTKGTAVRGWRLYSIIISKYYTPAVRGWRLKENIRLTAANMNLTKPQLLNKEGGQVARRAATKISAKATP